MEHQDRKPHWLKIKPPTSEVTFVQTRNIVRTRSLNTICVSGKCPNMSDCWSKGTATFMIAGNICTRSCKFCNTATGRPLPLDEDEPRRVAESIKLMNLKYAVITSVDRDDLPDQGANHWATTIRAIRELNPDIIIEALIPDFSGNRELIDIIIEAAPDVISHNMETVRSLTPSVRSSAQYDVSLSLLAQVSPVVITKSGIMLGLGEEDEEIAELMDDLINAGVKILTIGQYLRPSKNNIPVARFIPPEQFYEWKYIALDKGFIGVESGPLVRSSYNADKLRKLIK
jgi:lipoic acid synthetase